MSNCVHRAPSKLLLSFLFSTLLSFDEEILLHAPRQQVSHFRCLYSWLSHDQGLTSGLLWPHPLQTLHTLQQLFYRSIRIVIQISQNLGNDKTGLGLAVHQQGITIYQCIWNFLPTILMCRLRNLQWRDMKLCCSDRETFAQATTIYYATGTKYFTVLLFKAVKHFQLQSV